MSKDTIYLDYAAATPMDKEVLSAMESYFTDNFYNPSSPYLAAKSVKRALSEARNGIARRLGAKPAEIVFTAGATEANNLAVRGVMKNYPEAEILISAIEHDSVRAPAGLFNCQEVPAGKDGLIDPSTVLKMITGSTVLISIGMVNSELGVIQPLKDISSAVNAVRQARVKDGNRLPIYLHTDASQAPNYLDLNTSRLGVDMMSLNGGKIYGPKQSGLLFVQSSVRLSPLITGGGQEWGKRAGTENIPAVIGLALAVGKAQDNRSEESRRLADLRDRFIKNILDAAPEAKVNGSTRNIAPHIISLTVPGADNERLMMELDEAGVQCSTGSACHASSGEPSHVLSAIGLSDEMAKSTLRFSLGRGTTKTEIDKACLALKKLLAKD